MMKVHRLVQAILIVGVILGVAYGYQLKNSDQGTEPEANWEISYLGDHHPGNMVCLTSVDSLPEGWQLNVDSVVLFQQEGNFNYRIRFYHADQYYDLGQALAVAQKAGFLSAICLTPGQMAEVESILAS